MEFSLLNLGLAFLEGLALIISPCILPILPIILSGSLDGSKARPYGIITGFVICFALFTFFSRSLVTAIGLDLNLIRQVSFALLIFLGFVMISDFLTEKFEELTQRIAKIGNKFSTNSNQTGFWGGLFFGALIGLIWTPCAGPILAAVIVQSILQNNNWASFFTVLAFAVGVAIPMLLIILGSRALTNHIDFLTSRAKALRKIMGAIIIIAVLIMMSGISLFIPNIETTKQREEMLRGQGLVHGLDYPYTAPEFKDIKDWINSSPLTLEQLKNKVVLIDFWAYSCINCIRTLPYLKNWYDKYHDKGFEIIGVHSPEFDFESLPENVRKAVEQYKINYPVAMDNSFATWNAYKNHFWPAHYLIDKNGIVVFEHFGEGDYDVTEHNIRYLLGINEPMSLELSTNNILKQQTPETYLGYDRMDSFANKQKVYKDKIADYNYPDSVEKDYWALNGRWKITPEKIVSEQKEARIKLNYRAKTVYAVMGTTNNKPIKVTIYNKNKVVNTITVQAHLLYDLLSLVAPSNGILELTASAPGLEIYTFTFGS